LGTVLLVRGALAAAPAEPIEIAAEEDAAPWSKADGTGFANELVRAAFAAVAVDVRLRVLPYARCKHLVSEGNVAACFSMSRSPDPAPSVVFAAAPLFVCSSELFERVDDPRKINREGDIPERSVVGTVVGYEYPEAIYRLKKAGRIRLEEVDSEELNLTKLAAGRIRFAVMNLNDTKPAEWLMAKTKTLGKVEKAFRGGALESYIGFSVKHPRGLWALAKFNEGFRIITANGTAEAIHRRWVKLMADELRRLEGSK
jgi:ABC-type amino acid transport substrate-binding protein